MKHEFKDGQRVYMVIDEQLDEDRQPIIELIVGTITDERCADDYKFSVVPLEERVYIPVVWDGRGGGAPLYSSLQTSKEDAITAWKERKFKEIQQTVINLETQEI